MDRIDGESFWFLCPDFADVFVWRETVEGLEAPGVVICIDEVGEVAAELVMAVVVEPLDGRVFYGPVHSFDLTVRPWMIDFGEAVLDAILTAAHLKHVGHVSCGRAVGVARRIAELDAIVGQNGVDLVRNGLD
jgi:hypothetical protein